MAQTDIEDEERPVMYLYAKYALEREQHGRLSIDAVVHELQCIAEYYAAHKVASAEPTKELALYKHAATLQLEAFTQPLDESEKARKRARDAIWQAASAEDLLVVLAELVDDIKFRAAKYAMGRGKKIAVGSREHVGGKQLIRAFEQLRQGMLEPLKGARIRAAVNLPKEIRYSEDEFKGVFDAMAGKRGT